LVLKKLSEGVTIKDFIQMYPHITEEQIFAALEYAVVPRSLQLRGSE